VSDARWPAILRVAALVACYDRYVVTRRALATLFEAAQGIAAARFTVFLLDDASPDRTGERIRAEWPEVRLTMGDGTLFWNRGMHRLIEAARATGPLDAFLLLNDDVRLIEGRLGDFVATFRDLAESARPPILIGAMADPATGAVTYSGMRRTDRRHPLRLARVAPGAACQPCDAANGNLMLVPAAVLDAVDNLDPRYRHAIGDIDLCYRAAAAGHGTILAPGIYGWCSGNDIVARKLAIQSMRARMAFFFGPKQDLPGTIAFLRRYGDMSWPLHALVALARSTIATLWPTLYRRVWSREAGRCLPAPYPRAGSLAAGNPSGRE